MKEANSDEIRTNLKKHSSFQKLFGNLPESTKYFIPISKQFKSKTEKNYSLIGNSASELKLS